MRSTNIFIAILIMAATGQAFAKGSGGGGVFINPSVFFWSSSITALKVAGATQATPVTSFTFLNGKVGYAFSSGLLVAGVYDTESYTNSTSSTSNYNRSSFGATLGYSKNGWMLMASYLFSSTITYNTAPQNKWDPGSGIIVDLGYFFPVSSNFGIGPSLTYRSWSYTGFKQGSTAVANSNMSTNDILPMLNMMIDF